MKQIAPNTVKSNGNMRKIEWDFFMSFVMPQPAIRRELPCSGTEVVVDCTSAVPQPVGKDSKSA